MQLMQLRKESLIFSTSSLDLFNLFSSLLSTEILTNSYRITQNLSNWTKQENDLWKHNKYKLPW